MPDPDTPEGDSPTAHDLLFRMRSLQVRANVAEMARARTMTAMFQQFGSDVEARRAEDPHFTATPLAETVTETQPVTGQTAGRIRSEIETVLIVDQHLPWLAEHLDAGRLDLYRAKPVIDAFKDDLGDHPEARERFAELMRQWFARAAEVSPDLLNKTITQIRNHTHYVVTKVLAGEFDDRFKRRHRSRNVHTQSTGDGMGSLTIDTDLVSVKLAEHHLDALARDAARPETNARSSSCGPTWRSTSSPAGPREPNPAAGPAPSSTSRCRWRRSWGCPTSRDAWETTPSPPPSCATSPPSPSPRGTGC